MLLVRSLQNYESKNQGIALTIGNFDGLHLGHKSVLKKLLTGAKNRGLIPAVMCFEPQPKEFFGTGSVPARLSRFRDKFIGFKNIGIEVMYCLRFDKDFVSLSPESFVSDILNKKLNVKYIVIGDDFRFGAGGKGDYDFLKSSAQKAGFEVESLDTFENDHERISSTRIRKYLALGDLEAVKPLLGENFFIRGKVSHGRELGRTINFPTANINLNRRAVPLSGVYAVEVELPNNTVKQGIANVGLCPTVNGKIPRLEVYIFNFHQNIYYQQIKVSFLMKMRDERKFANLNELKAQISLDEENARKFFASQGRDMVSN